MTMLRSILVSLLLPPLIALVLIAALFVGANTDSGRRLVAWAVQEGTGGQVRLAGLAGRLPFSPRLARLEVRDREGAWLVLEGAALDLDPWALASGRLVVERLGVLSADLRRLPASGDSETPGIGLIPLPVEVRRAAIGALRIGPAGDRAPRLGLDGRATAGPGGVELALAARALGRGDRYRLDLGLTLDPGAGAAASADPPVWTLSLGVSEGEGGLLRGLLPTEALPWARALAPGEAPWRLRLAAAGPAERLDLLASLDAGPLQSALSGRLDLAAAATPGLRVAVWTGDADLALPGPDTPDESRGSESAGPRVAWERLRVAAGLRGPLRSPRVSMALESQALAAAGVGLDGLAARLTADADGLTLAADLSGLAAPGLPPGLLGPAARLELTGGRAGHGWEIRSARFQGPALGAAVSGSLGVGGPLDLDWSLDLTTLEPLAPGWSGRAAGRGTLSGPIAAPGLAADLDLVLTRIAGRDPVGPVRLAGRLEAGLVPPRGTLDLAGDWAGQPLALALAAETGGGGDWSLTLEDLRLAGLTASGVLSTAAGARLPAGEIRLRAEDLASLTPVIGVLGGTAAGPGFGSVLAGALGAGLRIDPAGEISLTAQGSNLGLGGPAGGDPALRIATLDLEARVADPFGVAGTAGNLGVTGLAAGPLAGDLTLHAAGPARDLELAAEGALALSGAPVDLRLAGRLQSPERRLRLDTLRAGTPAAVLELRAPALLELADGLALERLSLGLAAGEGGGAAPGALELSGRVLPALDLRARLSDLALDTLGAALGLDALGHWAGTLAGEAELRGPIAAPLGVLTLDARELRFTGRAGQALPPARLGLSARLDDAGTAIDARLQAGPRTRLTLNGRVGAPTALPGGAGRTARALDLSAEGDADLALLDPLLAPRGRQIGGEARVDARLSGTSAEPRLAGTLRLADAALHDRILGVSVTEIAGALTLDGDSLRTAGLNGRAGPGTVTLAGSVGLLAPGMPASLRLDARGARLVQLDALDARGDLELRLAGPLTGPTARAAAVTAERGPGEVLPPAALPGEALTLAGRIDLAEAQLRIPERLPAGVASLDVRERGQRRRTVSTPTPTAPLELVLDLTLSAPRGVRVTGRGVDAELGGEVQARGSLSRPALTGGLELRRGDFQLAGSTLRFTRGRIGFEGAGPGQGIDPSLDLEARAAAGGATAILAVAGQVSSPRIELRSEPELPEDEVLARLLFGTDAGRLSGLQAVRLGLAAAELAGIQALAGIGEGQILGRLRAGLGLDRLLVDGESGGAVLEGGRQLFQGFYLGARQGQRAGETQGVLRIEITPELKLEADVGAGGGTRAGAAFQRDY